MANKTKKGMSAGKKIAIGAGVAAVGAGAYYFLGPKGKAHQKKAKDWAKKMGNKVGSKIKKIKGNVKKVAKQTVKKVAQKVAKKALDLAE